MSTAETTISGIRKKIERLVAVKVELEKELEAAKESYRLLEQRIGTQRKRIEELEEKNKVLTMAKSLSDTSEGNLESKRKINELVREIDKCIALLNK
jgi:predicted  nucleic acid-binding Zn-ribbon protein